MNIIKSILNILPKNIGGFDMQTYDVIIIGAGIVGTSIARNLSRFKLDILLLEKANDVGMGSTKANSAIVHGGYAEKYTALKGRLCYKGRVQFKRLNEELNFGFAQTGSLVVTTEDDTKPLEELMENGIKNGLHDLSIIGAEKIRQLEPELSRDIKYALYCEGAGVCSPYEMAIALAENAVKNGVELKLEEEVTSIEKVDGVFRVTVNEKKEYLGRYVINAAGIYADKVSKMVGVDDFEILPRSGQFMIFTRGSGDPINTVVFQLPTKLGKGVLLTSTYYGNLLLGPDAKDDGEREDTSTHVERLAEIYRQTKALYHKLDPRLFIRSFTGIRARSSTDDFIIEETRVPGFINVAGIQSPGITSSPAIADMVVDILSKAGLRLEENPNFDPYRKPIITKKPLRPYKEIKDLLNIPSAPEKIICRCEQVTEAEIVDALHRGIEVKTVDGVKRRTRAGMGWCQGNFCRSRVVEIMEREYKKRIDPSDDVERSGVKRVTKSELLEYLKSQQLL
jgi:glycerol-3-phosphate dehydrogenase